MKTRGHSIAPVLLAAAMLFATSTHAATFCVGSSDALAAALATAEANGEDNDIRLRTGVYAAPDAGFHIDLFEGHHSLSVAGGFTDDACTEATHAASATVLDGRDAVRPLTIETSRSSGIADPEHGITVSALTFQHGSDALVGALKISDSGPIYGGIITVEGNAFLDNATASGVLEGGPALLAATDGPDFAGGTGLFVRNNLFARNTAPNAPAVFVYSNNHIDVSNNTFVGNVSTDTTLDERVTFASFTFSGVDFSNNVFRDNNPAGTPATFDLRATNVTDLVDNAIVAIAGTPRSESGTISADPRFVDAAGGNYRLAADSPLVDAGTDTPAGGAAAFDLDGVTRIQGAHIDIGASELAAPVSGDGIFADGFDGA
ncbi:MAG TPA: choice-of-anchor Q domain-containing protein [Rhodanobacteraceae bacterium]|nr:choice-of-anchor Q domain-containing protein [Rhodanobacteraceae bacterium]